MSRIYAMESGFLARLLSDRKELLAIARSFRTAEEMKQGRSDLMASASIRVTPVTADQIAKSYTVDAEGVAHIPVVGELTPAAQTDICGAYTAEALTEYGFIQAAAMAADEDMRVREIAFDIDSPGGYLDGLDQTAQVLAGLTKPTRSNVSNMAASAAYWLASQTDRIVASSPADVIGSIGVAVEHWDDTQALAQMGITRQVFTSTDAPDKRPDLTTDAGKAKLIEYLDATHAVFVSRVATGRGVSPKKVSEDFGRGGLLVASAAKAAGMIDGIRGETLTRPNKIEKPAGVAGAETAAKADGTLKTGGAKKMTLEELKRDNPALYAEATADALQAGRSEGVKAERDRITALEKWIAADAGNAKVAAIVAEAKATGKSEAEVMPQLQVAVRDAAKAPADPDNPPPVNTAATVNGAGIDPEVKAEMDRMAPKMGVSDADIKKFGGQKGGK